jgi:hypothetical protein
MKRLFSNKVSGSDKMHVVYFSCRKHFDYLFLSLKSLAALRSASLGNVYLYIDKEDFLTEMQMRSLKKLRSDLIVRKREKFSWAGEQTVRVELQVFKDISEEIDPEHYVAKVDSDVLFISDDVFASVLKSGDNLLGHKETWCAPFFFTQGGCYFLKSSFIPQLSDFNKDIFAEVFDKVNNETMKAKNRSVPGCPEDAVIYSIARSKTDKISFIDFYGSSVVHFNERKHEMLDFYKSEKMFVYGAKHPFLKILPASLRSMLRA